MPFRINTIEVSPLGEQYTQVAVVEGVFLGGRPVTVFDELTDTPASKSPNLFVAADAAGALLEYVDPEIKEGGGISLDFTEIRNNPTISAKLGDGLEIDADNAIAVDETILRGADRNVIAGDGLQGGGDLSVDITLEVDSTVVRETLHILAGDGIQGGGDLSSDRTVSVDSTVVRGTREINAGNGLIQDNNLLSGNINIDVQTPLNSGLSATTDDLQVDITGTQEATTVTGNDVFLLQNSSGDKYRITRDNLFAGIGGGTELRGSINPTSSWTPKFINSARVTIPTWTANVGDVITFTTVYRGDLGSGTNKFLLDFSGGNRTYIRNAPTGNWSFTSGNIDVFINDGTGEIQITDDTTLMTPDVYYDVRVVFKVSTSGITHIGGFYNGLGSADYNGEMYNLSFVHSGGDNRTYTSQLSQFVEPNTVTEYFDSGLGAQHGTLANAEWIIRSFETVTGDQINSSIYLGTPPEFNGVTPAGYTYVVLLNESDKSTGVRIRLGGGVNTPDEVIAFDQDQISWVGDDVVGGWAHLETGNSVISVFGRNGVIQAETGDYTASQVANVPNGNLVANNVQVALDELQGDIDSLGNVYVSKAGDTMTGNLTINSASPTVWLQSEFNNPDGSALYLGEGGSHGMYIRHTGDNVATIGRRLNGVDVELIKFLSTDTSNIVTISNPRSITAQGTNVASLTRKDYVDGITGNNTTYDGGRI